MRKCGRITPKMYFLIIFCLLFIALVALLFLGKNNWGKVYNDDIYEVSPDGRYTLIIKEWGTLGGTGADIYIESELAWWPVATRHQIGTTSADDSVYPFRDGYYQVSWESECVVIHYYRGSQRENSLDVDSWEGYIEYILS